MYSIRPPLSTNLVITVLAKRVNVNAVPAHRDDVVQDFRARGFGRRQSGIFPIPLSWLRLREDEIPVIEPPLLVLTNSTPRMADRVGANPPLLGETNGLPHQWQFYVFTNAPSSTNDMLMGITNGPNVAFVTFLPPNLSEPRNLEADIDLYVSRNPLLLELNDTAIENSWKSLNQGGSELVVLTGQPVSTNAVYYVGVKSEDQQASEYAIVVISREDPFEDFANGERRLRGNPLNGGVIPDGSASNPQAGFMLALGDGINESGIQRARVGSRHCP